MVKLDSLRIVQEIAKKREQLGEYDGGEVQRFEGSQITPLAESVTNFLGGPFDGLLATLARMRQNLDTNSEGMSLKTTILLGDFANIWKRKSEPKGPLAVFGYDFYADHAKAAGIAEPKLLSFEGLWGSGEEYAYEVLNFANGKRNAQEIRDAVSAEYGPVPLEMVVEYLKALEKIGIVEQVK
jgi:hypothetical protein